MADLRGRYDKMPALPPARRSDQRILHTVSYPPAACLFDLTINGVGQGYLSSFAFLFLSFVALCVHSLNPHFYGQNVTSRKASFRT